MFVGEKKYFFEDTLELYISLRIKPLIIKWFGHDKKDLLTFYNVMISKWVEKTIEKNFKFEIVFFLLSLSLNVNKNTYQRQGSNVLDSYFLGIFQFVSYCFILVTLRESKAGGWILILLLVFDTTKFLILTLNSYFEAAKNSLQQILKIADPFPQNSIGGKVNLYQ